MRVPVWAVGLVKLADRTDVDLYGLDEDPPDRVEVATTPLVPAAGEAFTADELEARIRFYAERVARELPACGESPAAPRATRARYGRRATAEPVKGVCRVCGAAFEGRPHKRHCSDRCRWKARDKGA